MKANRNLPLDQFIELALYDKVNGYYMKKNPFGKEGDFITAPNITRLFSEIIAIWVVTFWKSIGSPKNFNLLELGAGTGRCVDFLLHKGYSGNITCIEQSNRRNRIILCGHSYCTILRWVHLGRRAA